jgi:hypothetical protein
MKDAANQMPAHSLDGFLSVAGQGLPIACAGLSRQMAAGARLIEAQVGYPPATLMVAGLVVWVACLAVMAAN